MSEHMFGITRRYLPATVCAARDAACLAAGGTGYTQIQDPARQWLGWYTGPNLGEPFDRDRAATVHAAARTAPETIAWLVQRIVHLGREASASRATIGGLIAAVRAGRRLADLDMPAELGARLRRETAGVD